VSCIITVTSSNSRNAVPPTYESAAVSCCPSSRAPHPIPAVTKSMNQGCAEYRHSCGGCSGAACIEECAPCGLIVYTVFVLTSVRAIIFNDKRINVSASCTHK
jgi:hypothetical protein